jgi:hypothetical protein
MTRIHSSHQKGLAMMGHGRQLLHLKGGANACSEPQPTEGGEQMLPTQVVRQRGFSLAFCLIMTMLLSGCGLFPVGPKTAGVDATPSGPCGKLVDPITGEEHWPCQSYLVDAAHPELGSKCKLIYENRYNCNSSPTKRCHSVQTNGVWSCPCDSNP